jgi:YbbR domain-containing protein
MDTHGEKKLAIQPNWTGSLPPELIMQNFSVTPESVTVEGGNLVLDKIRTIYTEAIPLGDISSTGKMTVNLVLPPSAIKLTDKSPVSVDVSYTVNLRQ